MKNYLCAYVSHVQDDWVDHLLIVEFAANNHVNASTDVTPFFEDNGFHSCTDVEPPQTYQKAGRRAELLAADKIIANQKEIILFLKDQLAWAQEEQTHWANQHYQPYPGYKVGDIVYIDTKHFVSKRDSKLLNIKNTGLWKIT